MDERSYSDLIDKADWGPGPWNSEPDKIVWVDDATGLDCMIVRNRGGALCGYVGVPEGHPWHGKEYDDVHAEVHGGLTFSDRCMEDKREDEHAICHNPAGRPDNVWWLGFDCAHLWDLTPAYRATLRSVGLGVQTHDQDVYRDVEYVRREVTQLALQGDRAGVK